MEKETIQKAFMFLYRDNHEKIIFGAAKKLHLTPLQDDYQDFIQEGYLAFVQAYDRYPGSITTDPQKFCVFAYQAVYWRLLDLLRQTTRLAEHLETEHNEEIDMGTSTLNRGFENLYQDDLFLQLYHSCTPAEKKFLVDCYILQLRSSEIARKHHVTRQCVTNWRRRVGNKALAYIAKNSH
ncbi:sigma-70 family RNA polymerase sigma factor [Pediococcus siamensis]|uniref:sigma-70 family RNA polymerase sigma factor n=1 Tax=Pediococcus siamensis TaxID=381829 RepID=UPI00399F415D